MLLGVGSSGDVVQTAAAAYHDGSWNDVREKHELGGGAGKRLLHSEVGSCQEVDKCGVGRGKQRSWTRQIRKGIVQAGCLQSGIEIAEVLVVGDF